MNIIDDYFMKILYYNLKREVNFKDLLFNLNVYYFFVYFKLVIKIII